MDRFVVPVVVEANNAREATKCLGDLLITAAPQGLPIRAHYVGAACPIGLADRYSTEEVHLLCDGMRAITVPDRGA